MIVAIDGIALSHPQPGGYRTYTTNLVRHLAQVDDENQYVLLTDRPINWSGAANWRIEVIRSPCSGLGVVWREQVAVPQQAARQGAHILHSPCATGPLATRMPLLLTVYDTIEFTQPLPSVRETRRWAMRLYSRFVQKRAATRARGLITISEYSKRHIVSHFCLAPERVIVTHLAPSPKYREIDCQMARQQSRLRFGIVDQVLGFASAAPRKNVHRLMKAYTYLENALREKHVLALVCTHHAVHTRLMAQAEQLGIRDNVVLIDRPSDDDLLLLYNTASLFLFPSLEEGFGLPPLEAMACGTPVVASNTSSVPEVLGDAALLVPPTNVAAISDAMARVLTMPGLAEDLRERGLKRSQMFSWERTARETSRIYEQIANHIR